jgi:hypothetical protein
MDAIDIMDAIVGGSMDTQLDALAGAITDRRKAVAKRQLFELKPGDRVRVSGGIRPKYMIGAVGTVIRIGSARIDVQLDEDIGRFRAGRDIGFPPGTLEKLEA